MITQSLHSRFSSHMREMFRKRPAYWLQTCLYRHLTKAPHPLWYPSQASGIPWRSRTSAEERGCLNQGLKNNWTLWTSFHAIPHLLPLLLSGDLCYIFTCRLPQWIWWCTKQINLPCYYSCIYCVYGKSFLCVFPAKHVVFQHCCVDKTFTKVHGTFSTHPFLIHFYCLDCQVWGTSIGLNFICVGSAPSFSPTPFTIVGTMHRTWWSFVRLLLSNLFDKIPQSMRLIDDGEHRCRDRKDNVQCVRMSAEVFSS